MKTAEQILSEKELHQYYSPTDDPTRVIHDTECDFCKFEERVLESMEEYANQFKKKGEY